MIWPVCLGKLEDVFSIPFEFVDAGTDIVQSSMIGLVFLLSSLLLLLLLLLVVVGFPQFVVTIPSSDEFFDAGHVDDSVVKVLDEFGHFLDEEDFVRVDCVSSQTRRVGDGDSISNVGEDRCSDAGVWERLGGRETRRSQSGDRVLIEAPGQKKASK